MIYVLFFMFVILSCPTLLHSAMPTCPKSFSCPNLLPFKYPFYNVSDMTCGLIKVYCTQKAGNLIIGGRSYEIIKNYDSGSSLYVYDKTFDDLVKDESCEALMHNFSSPSPHLFSISIIHSFITVFKCTKNPNYGAKTDAYFHQFNYNSYNKCKDDNFYYKYSSNNSRVLSDAPHTCQVIRLPLKEPWQFENGVANETNIYSLLSSAFLISINLTASCEECNKNGSHCYSNHGIAQCTKLYEKGGKPLTLILALAGCFFILLLCPAIFIIKLWFKRKPFSYFSSKGKSSYLEDGSLYFGISVFSYSELEDATKNFDPSHELGDGGFGAVYYGKLQDGREVAVKRLYEHNYKRVQRFMNEVEILTKLHHPNLVVLYGCTSHQSRELLLVYEYISNGTVADHLHGERANPSLLTWPIRLNIATETASALVYLHASEIIHRDVKTTNILLDHNFSVKVADFGLSRDLPNNVSHVSTAPQGTPGYLDPQYHQCYQLTDKSDVYSFGVVLIELISSMVAVDLNRSRDEISLANLALNRIQRCEFDQLIDPVLGSDSDGEIKRMITSVAELAFQCLQFDSEMRPTMNEVLYVLMNIQTGRRIDGHDSITDFEIVNQPPPSEANDSMILLKDFLPSPVSVTGEWRSDKSVSTTISSNGDRLPPKNHISI